MSRPATTCVAPSCVGTTVTPASCISRTKPDVPTTNTRASGACLAMYRAVVYADPQTSRMSQENPMLDTLAANSSRCRLALFVIKATFTPRWRRALSVSIAPGSGWSPRYSTPSISIATCLITCPSFPVSYSVPPAPLEAPLRLEGGRSPLTSDRPLPPAPYRAARQFLSLNSHDAHHDVVRVGGLR